MLPIKKIKGFSDLFAPESTLYSWMEASARLIFSRYGYNEIRTPILEPTALFQRAIGAETDVVQKEMYTFLDRKDRSLTMRPEATAGVLRSYIENTCYKEEPISKLFTIGQMFRYERPQKGRLRQFNQINVEMLGVKNPCADAELISMLWMFLEYIAIPDLNLELNSLGCSICRPKFHQGLNDFLQKIDDSKFCTDCTRRKKTNPLRVLDCKIPACKELLVDAPNIIDFLCSDCIEHFEVVCRILRESNIKFELNPRLVRGLDYYQRTTFEVTSGKIGSQSAVAGGGRYDGLVELLGGPSTPGIGFACGIERLALLSPTQNTKFTDFYIIVPDESCQEKALFLAQMLRKSGFSGEVALEIKSFKSQIRQANKLCTRYALIFGERESELNQIIIKNMQDGTQETYPLDILIKTMQELLS